MSSMPTGGPTGGTGITSNRHSRKSGGYIVVGALTDLEESASKLFNFAHQLAQLTPDEGWPVVVSVENPQAAANLATT